MFDADATLVAPCQERCSARYRVPARLECPLRGAEGCPPEEAALLERLLDGRLPEGWADALPVFEETAIRAPASGQVLNAIAPVLPELWGSADLAGSNNTFVKAALVPARAPLPPVLQRQRVRP